MSLYNDASLLLIPSGYKSGKLYSQKPTDGSGDLTFTRASNATRVNSDGLIEGVRTNLYLRSNEFNLWSKSGTFTVTANDAISPDGTLNADRVEFTASNNLLYLGATGASGSNTLSVYAKAKNGISAKFRFFSNGNTLSSSDQTATGEWQRFTFTYTYSAVTAGLQAATTGADDILFYGFQQEVSPSATDYIPTTTTAVSVGMLANVPRIDYTGDLCGKLLLEKQSTNLITYSEDFSNVDWSKYNVTITANVTTSPDGTINASKYLDSTTNDTHNLYKAFSISGDTTFSIYVKSAEYTRFAITNLSDGGDVLFNLSTVAVISTSGNFQNGKIDSIGNGWYRVSATTNGTSGGKAIGFSLVNNSGATSFVGTGTKGVYVWGAQAEASSYPASYIPTLASSVTRLADAGTTNIASSVNASEGVLFLDYQPLNVSTSFPVDFQLQYNGTNAVNGVTIYHSGNTPAVTVRSGGNIIFEQALTATTVGTRNKIALAYKGSDFAVYQNGLQKGTQSSGVAPAALNELRLSDGLRDFSINQAIIFPTRLTNAQLATLTTL